jgi:hypothetical protein
MPCSICGLSGHYKTTCGRGGGSSGNSGGSFPGAGYPGMGSAPPPAASPPRAPRRCGNCNEVGHDVRTCGRGVAPAPPRERQCFPSISPMRSGGAPPPRAPRPGGFAYGDASDDGGGDLASMLAGLALDSAAGGGKGHWVAEYERAPSKQAAKTALCHILRKGWRAADVCPAGALPLPPSPPPSTPPAALLTSL